MCTRKFFKQGFGTIKTPASISFRNLYIQKFSNTYEVFRTSQRGPFNYILESKEKVQVGVRIRERDTKYIGSSKLIEVSEVNSLISSGLDFLLIFSYNLKNKIRYFIYNRKQLLEILKYLPTNYEFCPIQTAKGGDCTLVAKEVYKLPIDEASYCFELSYSAPTLSKKPISKNKQKKLDKRNKQSEELHNLILDELDHSLNITDEPRDTQLQNI